MSDLYVYFFLRGISLLRQGGVMCFICSGSWLDVGFGQGLQSLLLKHTRIIGILDSATQRTFSTADVNTTINLFVRDPAPPLDHLIRFMLLRGPLEDVTTPDNLRTIANATAPLSTPAFRVVPVLQSQLAVSENDGRQWGGRYLRAPDVFAELCALPALVPTSRVARARLGVTTGANEFFFLKRLAAGHYESAVNGIVSLPDERLTPIIRSVSECGDHAFHATDATYYLLMVGRECRDPRVLAYVRAGEASGIADRPFFAGKACWYEIRQAVRDPVAVSEISYKRYFALWNPDSCVLNKNLYGFASDLPADLLYALIAWTPTFLFYELRSRKLGAGASGISVKVANQALLLSPERLTAADRDAVVEAAAAIRWRATLDVELELQQPDRQVLDERLLRAAGAAADLRARIYDALLALVEARVVKAKSL